MKSKLQQAAAAIVEASSEEQLKLLILTDTSASAEYTTEYRQAMVKKVKSALAGIISKQDDGKLGHYVLYYIAIMASYGLACFLEETEKRVSSNAQEASIQ